MVETVEHASGTCDTAATVSRLRQIVPLLLSLSMMLTSAAILDADSSPKPSPQPQTFSYEALVAARQCRSGKELDWQTDYCSFKVKGLSIEIPDVNGDGANLTISEIDPEEVSFAGFSPGDECVVFVRLFVSPAAAAAVHIRSAKVFRTKAECEAYPR